MEFSTLVKCKWFTMHTDAWFCHPLMVLVSSTQISWVPKISVPKIQMWYQLDCLWGKGTSTPATQIPAKMHFSFSMRSFIQQLLFWFCTKEAWQRALFTRAPFWAEQQAMNQCLQIKALVIEVFLEVLIPYHYFYPVENKLKITLMQKKNSKYCPTYLQDANRAQLD